MACPSVPVRASFHKADLSFVSVVNEREDNTNATQVHVTLKIEKVAFIGKVAVLDP